MTTQPRHVRQSSRARQLAKGTGVLSLALAFGVAAFWIVALSLIGGE